MNPEFGTFWQAIKIEADKSLSEVRLNMGPNAQLTMLWLSSRVRFIALTKQFCQTLLFVLQIQPFSIITQPTPMADVCNQEANLCGMLYYANLSSHEPGNKVYKVGTKKKAVLNNYRQSVSSAVFSLPTKYPNYGSAI